MKIPKLPRGSIIPTPPNWNNLLELKENETLRKQYIHDYKIAILGIVGGGITGFISSIIVWLITK